VPILNYTTTVSAAKTLAQVQAMLVKARATSVAFEYHEGGRVKGISFCAGTPLGERWFALPINTPGVAKVLHRQFPRRNFVTGPGADQAERVACRIVKDWLEAQLAIIESEMVTLDEVMLPYMRAGDSGTVYDLYRGSQLALPKAGP
jgi:hypothetical protein